MLKTNRPKPFRLPRLQTNNIMVFLEKSKANQEKDKEKEKHTKQNLTITKDNYPDNTCQQGSLLLQFPIGKKHQEIGLTLRVNETVTRDEQLLDDDEIFIKRNASYMNRREVRTRMLKYAEDRTPTKMKGNYTCRGAKSRCGEYGEQNLLFSHRQKNTVVLEPIADNLRVDRWQVNAESERLEQNSSQNLFEQILAQNQNS